ncbi:MAG: flagellar motor protein MotB [Alphaproteobacteria bacterium]|nr:flagellar motor protein MotB [Alphaproteobacteria bacterium]
MASNKSDKNAQPIIIKRVKKSAAAHHGGAWKVAYADFVTAMMALFLLLWLLNVTTDEQKAELAAFFIDPTHPKVSKVESGADGVLGGTSISKVGAMSEMLTPPVPPLSRTEQQTNASDRDLKHVNANQFEKLKAEQEEKDFMEASEKLQQAIRNDPELKELSKNLLVDMTSEGLRIQIVDQQGKPMFASGSAKMFDKTQKLMTLVAKIVKTMSNDISIRGHTDGKPFRGNGGYTNWELSADRANASRRALVANGVPMSKIANVVGKSDTDHLNKDNPLDSKNRRISIIILKESITNGSGGGVNTNNNAPKKPKNYQRSRGSVQFP